MSKHQVDDLLPMLHLALWRDKTPDPKAQSDHNTLAELSSLNEPVKDLKSKHRALLHDKALCRACHQDRLDQASHLAP